MATSGSALLPAQPAIRTRRNAGNGRAASILAPSRASTAMASRRRSRPRAPRSRRHGASFCRGAARRIFRPGAINRHGPQKSIGALIAASGCWRTGGRMGKAVGWGKKEFYGVQASEKVVLAAAYGSDPRRPAAPMSGLISPPFSRAVCVRTSISPSAMMARPMITPNKSSAIIISPVRAGVRYRSDPKRITTAPMRIAASPMQQALLSRQAICWRGGGDPAFNWRWRPMKPDRDE
jgi:hypothetical protein